MCTPARAACSDNTGRKPAHALERCCSAHKVLLLAACLCGLGAVAINLSRPALTRCRCTQPCLRFPAQLLPAQRLSSPQTSRREMLATTSTMLEEQLEAASPPPRPPTPPAAPRPTMRGLKRLVQRISHRRRRRCAPPQSANVDCPMVCIDIHISDQAALPPSAADAWRPRSTSSSSATSGASNDSSASTVIYSSVASCCSEPEAGDSHGFYALDAGFTASVSSSHTSVPEPTRPSADEGRDMPSIGAFLQQQQHQQQIARAGAGAGAGSPERLRRRMDPAAPATPPSARARAESGSAYRPLMPAFSAAALRSGMPSWFHGKITREEGKARLRAAGLRDGLFLVREKEHNTCYAIDLYRSHGPADVGELEADAGHGHGGRRSSRAGGFFLHRIIQRAERTDGSWGSHWCINFARLRECITIEDVVCHLELYGDDGVMSDTPRLLAACPAPQQQPASAP